MGHYVGNDLATIAKVRKHSYRYIATAGQTTFSGTDTNGYALNVNIHDVEVFFNGIMLDQTDYVVSETQLQLVDAAVVGDIVEIITASDFVVDNTYNKSEVDLLVTNAVTTAATATAAAIATDNVTDDGNALLNALIFGG